MKSTVIDISVWRVARICLAVMSWLFIMPALANCEEVAYEDASVALIDVEEGYLGITHQADDKSAIQQYALKVDLENVYVTNPANQYLEFTDVKVGDHVDVYTEKDQQGQERVVDIRDYSQVAKD